jgi:hypothetical protein
MLETMDRIDGMDSLNQMDLSFPATPKAPADTNPKVALRDQTGLP